MITARMLGHTASDSGMGSASTLPESRTHGAGVSEHPSAESVDLTLCQGCGALLDWDDDDIGACRRCGCVNEEVVRIRLAEIEANEEPQPDGCRDTIGDPAGYE